jgi:hypothetical protein
VVATRNADLGVRLVEQPLSQRYRSPVILGKPEGESQRVMLDNAFTVPALLADFE